MRTPKNSRLLGVITLVLLILIGFGCYLQREKDITLEIDNQKETVTTRCLTTGGLLRERNISLNEKDKIEPSYNELLKPGQKVVINKCAKYRIDADGHIIYTEHCSLDKKEIVEACGIKLGPKDKISGVIDKAAPLVCLAVIRVEEVLVKIEENIPIEQKYVLDSSLKPGNTKIIQEGEDGLQINTVLIHKENGQATGSRVIQTETVKEMKPRITALGTRGDALLASRSFIENKKELILTATAYTHTGNPTFTGVYPRIGTIAVDPRVIPLGARMWVEGYGYGVAEDTGGMIKGNRIDLFMETEDECLRWGRRRVRVYVLE